jgi:multidrug efflux pump subunit AcrB
LKPTARLPAGDVATVTHGFSDPPDFVVRQKDKPTIGIGVVMAKGANILEMGPAASSATADFMAAVPRGFDLEQIADQPAVVEHAVGEFVHSFIEALAIVLFVSFSPLAAHWHRRRAVGASCSGHCLRRYERHGSRPSPDLAWCTDHRARPPVR